jgi:tetratricopeptide (TPR) repeat protein
MQLEVDLDPLNVPWRAVLSSHLTSLERFQEAVANADKAIEIAPQHWLPHFILAGAYASRGEFDRAVAAAEKARQIAPWHNMNTGMLAGALDRIGETARSRELIQGMDDTPVTAVGMMLYHLIRNDTEAAADWYERVIEMRSPFAVIFARGRLLKDLHTSPHWPRLARLMKLPDDRGI